MKKTTKSSKRIELTEQEINYLYTLIHMAGFREKTEFPIGLRKNRTDMQRIMGRILKKLRKAEHFISD